MLRSPRHQPREPLQNEERPLPIGWKRAFSNNVEPGRVYYTNGRQSQWNFPNQAEQEDREIGGNLRENLELIINNNNFNELNMGVLSSLRRMILEDIEQPINISTIVTYRLDLESLILILRDNEVHYDLKHLCKKLFEEIYDKLAKEKQIIDSGDTSHNQRATKYLQEQLNRMYSIYNRFKNIINN